MVYRDGEGHDLQDLVVTNEPQWQMLFGGNAINDKGQIVGMGRLTDGSVHAFLATPVPEPSTQALLLCGTGFLGMVLYRRQSRRPA
ncbi:PEP-CTERM sorting domain-containing protein [Azohydromonas caseinilytica]|uniref:PEP-CTERM sorting domain-containing protein n=1 Tax=Azohydromonas caseinilytica TaxID=2728836 RepID=A0A848FJI8_9BURK|nr:PEP-CTERM sorting domain-containing protein [Azohydromonas caseinilytica]NML18380.1 PEP-CTERM sorting domain-containing protein [Azohydromonas caseinilytica]